MRPFVTQDDALGNMTNVIPVSDNSIVLLLTPGVAKSVLVPTDARLVLFAATGNFWLQLDDAVSLPLDDIVDGSAPSLNPTARIVRPGQNLGLVANAACMVNLAFYG